MGSSRGRAAARRASMPRSIAAWARRTTRARAREPPLVAAPLGAAPTQLVTCHQVHSGDRDPRHASRGRRCHRRKSTARHRTPGPRHRRAGRRLRADPVCRSRGARRRRGARRLEGRARRRAGSDHCGHGGARRATRPASAPRSDPASAPTPMRLGRSSRTPSDQRPGQRPLLPSAGADGTRALRSSRLCDASAGARRSRAVESAAACTYAERCGSLFQLPAHHPPRRNRLRPTDLRHCFALIFQYSRPMHWPKIWHLQTGIPGSPAGRRGVEPV